ncbi:MAG: hypothetical protein Q8L24_01120 [bacterium]|nr:hypothetical protein [bacterium]
MRKRGITLGEILVIVVSIGILVAILLLCLEMAQRNEDERSGKVAVDWVSLGEGCYDHAEYLSNRNQRTIIYFSDGRTVSVRATVAINYPKGSEIRVSQKRFAAGTLKERLEEQYRVDPLDAEAK